jgi:hypothetical protein
VPRRPLGTRYLLRVFLGAAVLAVAWGAVTILGARSNAQGAIEMAAYGTIILFPLTVFVQLLVITWFERRGR